MYNDNETFGVMQKTIPGLYTSSSSTCAEVHLAYHLQLIQHWLPTVIVYIVFV